MAFNQNSILVRRLQQSKLIDPEATFRALQQKNLHYQSVVALLIGEKLIQAKLLAQAAASLTLHSALDLDFFDINSIPEHLRNEKLIRKHSILPLRKKHKMLTLAVADPTDLSSVEDFEFNTGLNAEVIVVEFDKLLKAIDKLFETTLTDTPTDTQWDLAKLGLTNGQEDQATSVGSDSDDQPIISFINKVLQDAIRKGASDLHFEPYEKSYRIRFRIDGILHAVASPPVALSNRLSARLKVMSRLDIAEKRVPQDGRIKLNLSQKKSVDFRVSTLPTLWGEKIVMRILDSDSAALGIDVLGYEEQQKQLYLQALAQPQGMILVTGPTGSGKTVSLYTGLHLLNKEHANISTAEDPVEINLPGINQVQINPKAGLTFPSVLKAFLRQDPDVIMVGEIRDLETAEIAIKAAQTGHLVLSTLHTNSAAETLTRLLNMGVPAYNLASAVSLIIAQRLARRLCPHCKQTEYLTEQEALKQGFSVSQLNELSLFKPAGCEHCNGGYQGRLGIYEVMPVTEQISHQIIAGAHSAEIAAQAQRDGMTNLRQSALKKVAAGITSLAEVNRVTQA